MVPTDGEFYPLTPEDVAAVGGPRRPGYMIGYPRVDFFRIRFLDGQTPRYWRPVVRAVPPNVLGYRSRYRRLSGDHGGGGRMLTRQELEQIEERRFDAYNLLGNLAVSGRLKMSIPAQETDEDMILGGPLLDIPRILTHVDELESRIHQWISARERLPRENEMVLFGVFDPVTQIYQGYLRDGVIMSDLFDGYKEIGPWIYWMPILPYPEEIES